jgi:hypothetical protein
MHRLLTVIAAAFVVAFPAGAQQFHRRATLVGGGGGDRGKCTIEVVVDGVAEVEIRGDEGILRNISGPNSHWRRFQCTDPLPRNPVEFRYQGINGRGRQDLVRDPRNGGVAVVRIDDRRGADVYVFELLWHRGFNRPPDRIPERIVPERVPERVPRRFTVQQAVEVCKDSVRNLAFDRYRGRRVEFLNTRIDDNPGRNDWVVGVIDVFRGREGWEGRYRFSCSVNFDTGRVRSADIEPTRRERNWR